MQKTQLWPLRREDPWRRKWQPTLVFLLENPMEIGTRWATVSPWGCKSDMTQQVNHHHQETVPCQCTDTYPGYQLPHHSCSILVLTSVMVISLSLFMVLLSNCASLSNIGEFYLLESSIYIDTYWIFSHFFCSTLCMRDSCHMFFQVVVCSF